MTDETSARTGLPLLQPGQAQKEMGHNEALALIDLLLQPTVVTVGLNVPPAAPAPGACWIVGAAPTGDWGGMRRRWRAGRRGVAVRRTACRHDGVARGSGDADPA
ncbi:DUF2793 domain-containing protein [Sphingomonas aerolata]|uniref:DUF2793 domain-containing protein n=1 Tax=Sphingomonas aerolata TaxID=185951 RepID=UPI002FE27813